MYNVIVTVCMYNIYDRSKRDLSHYNVIVTVCMYNMYDRTKRDLSHYMQTSL